MSRPRYEVRGRIAIDAPIERVYSIAIDPEMVPKYTGEIVQIRALRQEPRGARWVQSYIRACGVTIPFEYRYRYSPPHYYGGVQTRRALVRGYFTMRFTTLSDRTTEVEHVEGITSRVPMLGRLAGWIWFRLLSPDGPGDELRKLKALVESVPSPPLPGGERVGVRGNLLTPTNLKLDASPLTPALSPRVERE